MFTGIYTPLQDGASPLFIASQEGHSEVVDVLLKNGADINQPMNVGRGLTYIWYTHSVCSSLIPLTQDGATPLYVASENGHSDTVNTLIRNGADINQPANVGRGLTYGTLILYVHHLFLSHRLVQHLCT